MTTRRDVLRNIGAIGCSAAAAPLVTPVVFAAAPVDTRLVVIILRGAMDGLDVVQPYGDPDLSRWRQRLAIGPQNGALDLDGFYALHPALSKLKPLWDAGDLGLVHAVSTPYRNKRSHFDGQDFLENGGGRVDGQTTSSDDGWINRLLPLMGGTTAKTAFSVGRARMQLVSGPAQTSSWSPNADLDLSDQAKLLLELIYANDPLFLNAASAAADLSQTMGNSMNARQAGRAEALASFAADRLNEETRIAAFSLSGFDTHRNQRASLTPALSEVQTAILTLRRRLGRNWDKTAVLAITEFGRTVAENGTVGTDHGTGGAMIMAGGAIAGGKVRGRWPGLDEADLFDRRDLMPTDDLRRFAAWTIRDLFGVRASDVAAAVFPGVELGDNPGLLL